MTNDNQQQTRSISAGERLRNARQSAGLAPEEVARQLNLRVSVITAIEQAEYDRIDSELFLKGYVRAYAALVSVDGDSVIRQLDQELEPARQAREAQVEASPLVSIQKRKRMKKRVAKLVLLLFLLVVTIYAGSFYLTQVLKDEFGEPAGSEPVVSVEGGQGSAADLSGPLQSPPPAASEQTSAPVAPETEPDPVSSRESDAGRIDGAGESASEQGLAPQGSVAGTAVPSEADLSEPEPTEPGAAQLSDGRSDPATASEAAPMIEDPDLALSAVDAVVDPAPAAAGGDESAAGPRGLQVTFTDDCWVEVRDATGRTLVSALRGAGDTLELEGQAPLRVVFGAVSAVGSVRYNGEPVDLASFPARGNRVVFTLEP